MKTGNKKYLLLFALVTLGVSIINGLINVQYGALTDVAFVADFSGMVEVAKVILLLAGALMLFQAVSNIIEKYYFEMTMVDLKRNYIDVLFGRHRLTQKNSVYVSHLSNDADRLEQQYYRSIIQLLYLVIQIAVSTAILARYSVFFVVVVIALGIIFYSVASKTSEPVQKEEKNKSFALEGYTRFVEESLDGFSVIKSHQIENEREARFYQSIEGLKKQHYKIEKQRSLVDALNGVLQGVIIGTLMVVGLFIGNQSGLSLGSNMVVVLLFGNLLWPLQRVTPLVTELSGMKTVMSGLEDVLYEHEETGQASISTFESLEFINADLGYDKSLLHDVNLKIEANQKVLIVGPSGAGKSTILKTIQRDINHLEGSVLMNGASVDSYDLTQYYNLISIVDQIGYIFSGTVEENITMLQNQKIDHLLDDVSLSHLKSDLELINNGDNVSGGERARLLLARALYFNKELVICDEILSSLDSEVAKGIERDILAHAKTLINVSHIVFVDNLKSYDTFVIVDDGKVLVTTDASKVLERMIDSDIEFK